MTPRRVAPAFDVSTLLLFNSSNVVRGVLAVKQKCSPKYKLNSNFEEHSRAYSELATKNDFDFSEEWSSVQPNSMPDHKRFQTSGADRISDPFAIVTDPATSIHLDASRPRPQETEILPTVIPVSEGGNICPSTYVSTLEKAAANHSRKF